MIFLFTIWVFFLAIIRLLSYILYLFNGLWLFKYIIFGLFLIVYILFRLSFFYTPFRLTVKLILRRANKLFFYNEDNKYYVAFLRLCYILRGQSAEYYMNYFCILYLKWQSIRYDLQYRSLLSYIKFFIKDYIDRKNTAFRWIYYRVKYWIVEPVVDPENPSFWILQTAIYKKQYREAKLYKNRFTKYYKQFHHVILHYSLIILWFCPLGEEGFFGKITAILLQFRLNILDHFIKDCVVHLKLPEEVGNNLMIEEPLPEFMVREVAALNHTSRGLEGPLSLYYRTAGANFDEIESGMVWTNDDTSKYYDNYRREVESEFGNWIYNDMMEMVGYLQEERHPVDKPAIFAYDAERTFFLQEEQYIENQIDDAIEEGGDLRDFVDPYALYDYDYPNVFPEIDSLWLTKIIPGPMVDSFNVNIVTVFLTFGWAVLMVFSIILLSRQLQYYMGRLQHKFAGSFGAFVYLIFNDYVDVEGMLYLFLWLIIKLLGLNFFGVDVLLTEYIINPFSYNYDSIEH